MIKSNSANAQETKFRNPFDSDDEEVSPPPDDNAPKQRRESTLNQSKADIPSGESSQRPRRNSQLRTSQGVPIEGAEANAAIEEDQGADPDVSEVGEPKVTSNGPHRGSLAGPDVQNSNDWATGAFSSKSQSPAK
ncbi:hypothetical protein E3P92_02373 [Wallemia ichthyophaga]|uniref:Uncharacterized protein n=2 Tax=Wallemia ichthyophaga TaxID=245174 RepID=A0A4T0J269_WALIC|nr:uncharacterized protein J056_003462 [Wallemia ichthyophaga EXF-994]TIA71775.1 hypothetical protein E3P91_02385 [Wallemia ichthyophaga]EOR02900.1 hypothetical protein J056_003462 [Wallemia ichthyophaga EXF-994]TIA90861.1 hypothetical protein E3P97_02315 [Wallemia ichthyophaga]TIA99771.1 hypothetical protein E3P95_01939 [Wallemia ichthyophaga]TIB00796.1 hypothetical protein E3P94_02063 [Wallemia ichthyophaga]